MNTATSTNFLSQYLSRSKTTQWQQLLFIGIYLVGFAGFLELCQWQRTHLFSISTIVLFIILSGTFLVNGRLFLYSTALPWKLKEQPAIQLLLGFFIVNTLLFLFTFTTSLKIATSFWIIVGISFILFLLFPKKASSFPNSLENHWPGLLCLLFSGLGATLWCHDALSIPINDGQTLFFPIWQDSFSHARQISAFAQSEGAHSISNFIMAGTPLRIYHYAVYMMPAVVLSITHASGYEIFSSFLLPLGVFLSGIGAFSLATALWGLWPGVAATIAVVLLPDAYQQGFSNKFLGYHFLQQVGPAGLYGVAVVAISWVFILEGCKSKKWSLIGFGYALLAITLCYKAHIFVSNAYLVMIYPCFFFLQCRRSWRLITALLLTIIFVSVVFFAQFSPSVPLMKLDGSSLHRYAELLLNSTDPGILHSFFTEHLISHPLEILLFGTAMAAMIFFCTLGCWGPLWIMNTFLLRQKTKALILLFPLLVIANYLIMSLGLAFDTKHIGMPEELVHRPFVWAYFAIAAWTSAGLYFLIFGDRAPRKPLGQVVVSLLMLASICTPLYYAHGLQTMPLWGKTLTSNAVPADMMKAIKYICTHSNSSETLQDSEGDPVFIVTGLSERQSYATTTSELNICLLPGLPERLHELEAFKKMTTEKDLYSFLQTHAISWYLLRPETIVGWPASFQNSFVFQADGYRVYHWRAQTEKNRTLQTSYSITRSFIR